MSAAENLFAMGTRSATRALLDRYSINVSPSVEDEVEKQEIHDWLVAKGDAAVIEAITAYLKDERNVFWPIKILGGILPHPKLAAKLNEILRFHLENPPASPEPITQVLRSITDIQSEELEGTVRRFLDNPDDDVRLAALDFLSVRPEEHSRDAVLDCFVESEDRPRVRRYILDLLVDQQWSVTGYRRVVEENLPEGYSLTRDSRVKKLGTAT